MMDKLPTELLTTQELAEYLKLNPQTVLRKARGGELPAIKLGKEFRFLKQQIDQWLLSKAVARLQVLEKVKLSEEAVPPIQAELASLAKNSLVGMYIIQDGKFLYVNPKFAEILGYTEDELLSLESALHIVAEDDHTLVAENIRKRVEGKVACSHYTCQAKRKEGTLIDLEVLGTSIEIGGKPAIIGMALDITQPKRLQKILVG